MEKDSYYFRVGLFVIASFMAAVVVIGWFASNRDEVGHTPYAIYFNGSVDGLTAGAPIRLRGIQVGFVSNISFAAQDDDTIRVIAQILDTAPIHSNTRATLQMQGITGTSFVGLENINEKVERISAKDKDNYLIIASRQSSLERVFTSVPDLIEQVTKLAVQGQKMLNDDNVNAVHNTLTSVSAAVSALGNLVGSDKKGAGVHETLEDLGGMIEEAKSTLREVKMLARTLREDPSIIIHGVQHDGVKLQ